MVRLNNLLAVSLLTVGCASVSGIKSSRNVTDAEIGFAKDAQIRTVNEAFITAFAPGAIIFRPTPMDAHEVFRTRPFAPNLRLVWTPSTAETAAAADLAVTSGPARWGVRGGANTGSGYFLSVWRWNGKQWQVMFDAGIEAPVNGDVEPGVGLISTQLLQSSPSRSDDIEQMQNDILHIERLLIDDYAGLIREHAASDVRVFRNGKAPTITSAEALNTAIIDENVEWTPQAAFVSKSGDLGYVYGTAKAGNDTVGYVRVYRNQDARWKVAYDLR